MVFQRLSFLAGSTAAALLVTLPAHAEEAAASAMVDSTDALATEIEFDAIEAAIEPTGFEMANIFAEESAALVEAATATEPVAVSTLDDYLVEAGATSEPVATSAESFFADTEVADAPVANEGEEVAQVTRPLYRGVTPFYIGVGGNIGIIDSGNSAVGDFGFNIISKISLGPRFAVRPSLQFSEDDFNITLPITYNFNPIDLGQFSVYPSFGGGVDFGDDVGLLLNGGLDVPISRDFTLNSQVNWRVTEDTGLGVSLGVGYNFGVFFE
ncbi:MAG: hypothetical protein ACFBSG_07990 [Leptolyngbyaceae cyanobacterium]